VQISHFLKIFQNLKFKGQKFVPRRKFAKMRRVRHGPVMVAGKPGSVPADAHSALCLQMPSLAVCKTLGAHARIQAFRRCTCRQFRTGNTVVCSQNNATATNQQLCSRYHRLSSLRPAPTPARSFKKRARRRLKAWMRACAPNVLLTASLGICRHKPEWATTGTLPGSPATITGPWRTRRIFANRLRGTNFWTLNLRFWKVICTFFGRRRKSRFLTHGVLSGNCHR